MTDAAETISQWRKDPVRFVRDNFDAEPDDWQREVLEAFSNERSLRIAMKASKGPGKTCALAWCIWNFLACYGEAEIGRASCRERV